MFEKEAEEYIKEHSYFDEEFGLISLDVTSKTAFKDGAEFGYKKGFEFGVKSNEKVNQIVANEWHYVKDGDLPKDDKQYLVLFFYNYKGKKEMSFGVRDNLHSDFEIHRCYTEQIIAWKEIVLPELKETK